MAIALVVLAFGDEAPIAGTVKAIDASAHTLTLQTTAKGKTRDVTILLKPDSKIVKFARATEPGKTGFVEQPLTLADRSRAGSSVSPPSMKAVTRWPGL